MFIIITSFFYGYDALSFFFFHRRKERASVSSNLNAGEEDEEDMWVERSVKCDAETVFVGPIPEIKVQATMGKKE